MAVKISQGLIAFSKQPHCFGENRVSNSIIQKLRSTGLGVRLNFPQFNGYFESGTMSLKEYPNYEAKKAYTTYTKEFKQEAVRLMETSDRSAAENPIVEAVTVDLSFVDVN